MRVTAQPTSPSSHADDGDVRRLALLLLLVDRGDVPAVEGTMKWHYVRAGRVERGARYEWRDGYARVVDGGGTLYPWMTKREAQQAAREAGAHAVFHETAAAAWRASP